MIIGTLTFDEILCDITRIVLKEGVLIFEATSRVPGDYHVDEDADITVFAPDGTVIIHVPSISIGARPQVTQDGDLFVSLPVRMAFGDRTSGDGRRLLMEL